jgi:hypothetical protein
LSVGSSGGREKLEQEQSNKKMMAKKLHAEIKATFTTMKYAPDVPFGCAGNGAIQGVSGGSGDPKWPQISL